MFNEQEQKRAKETKRAGLFRTLAFVFMFLLLAGSLAGIGAMLFDNSSPLDEAGRGTTADTLWAGDGSSGNPWVISTKADLQTWAGSSTYWAAGKYTQLAADIDWGGSGGGNYPRVTSFAGNFDGKNHVVKNLYMSYAGTSSVGFISVATGTITIKNLGLINMTITGDSYVGSIIGQGAAVTISNCFNSGGTNSNLGMSGGIAGYISGTGSIEQSFNTGLVVGRASYGGWLGGIIGYPNSSLTISRCFNAGTVTGWNTGGTSQGRHCGGIIGGTASGLISDTYNVGTVTSSEENSYPSGGVVGQGATNVSRFYNAGNTKHSVGPYSGVGTLTNCYYKSTSATIGTTGSTSVTQAQMVDNTTL